nr:glutamine synthetase cytosolic isozyme-like isoform X2 [Solanum lycopersicum]
MSLLDLVNLDLSECHETNKSRIIAEYIWIDGSDMNLRSKGRTLHGPVTSPSQIPNWNYDGSSTGQAPGEDSEVILYPQAIYKDPFRGGNHILVMCDAYTPAGEPIPTNKRFNAVKIFSHPEVLAEIPWFGIEQEYTLLQKNLNWPLGWPIGGYRGPQGPYFCGVGAEKAFGRDIVNSHYKACLYAGVNIGGINAEVMAGQRIAEAAGVIVSFDPKPVEGDCNGTGAHTNYSTKSMRADGGLEVINKAIEKLGKRHKEHIVVYGVGNERRLTGEHETADINTFNFGIADRGASIRIGREMEKAGKGYLEDRRPFSNMDPYMVTFMIAETTILWKP